MSTAYSGRVGGAIFNGADFVPIWDGQVIEEEWLVVVKGTRNLEQVLDFVAHVAEPEQQAAQAKWIPYGPMRKSALDIIAQGEPWFNNGKEVLPLLPDRPELLPRSVIANSEWWRLNSQEITRRYKAFFAIK